MSLVKIKWPIIQNNIQNYIQIKVLLKKYLIKKKPKKWKIFTKIELGRPVQLIEPKTDPGFGPNLLKDRISTKLN